MLREEFLFFNHYLSLSIPWVCWSVSSTTHSSKYPGPRTFLTMNFSGRISRLSTTLLYSWPAIFYIICHVQDVSSNPNRAYSRSLTNSYQLSMSKQATRIWRTKGTPRPLNIEVFHKHDCLQGHCGNVWVFLVVMMTGGHHWHLVGRDQKCCTSCDKKAGLTQELSCVTFQTPATHFCGWKNLILMTGA